MKPIFKHLLILLVLVITLSGLASCQSKNSVIKTSFKVYGNCGMCKKTIEGSLADAKGIKSKGWNKKTKILSIEYDSTQIKMAEIHKLIATSGYDTELVKGNDAAYENLHECCHYDRAKY